MYNVKEIETKFTEFIRNTPNMTDKEANFWIKQFKERMSFLLPYLTLPGAEEIVSNMNKEELIEFINEGTKKK